MKRYPCVIMVLTIMLGRTITTVESVRFGDASKIVNGPVKPVINYVCKDHRDKIKIPDPVVKDLISKKIVEQII